MAKLKQVLKTVKFWAGVVGAGATAAGGVAGPPAWLLVVGSFLTGLAVWELPYQPAERAE